MAAPSLASLLLQQTQAVIYSGMLSIATTLGLPVTSWQPGDPTRSLFFAESTLLATLENIVVGFIQSGFLDYAAIPNADGTPNPWLAILAQQVYNVDVPAATYATTTETLTNLSGFVYVIAPGDLTFKCTVSGATYHNTTGGTLTGVGTVGATLSLTLVADQPGSASTAGAGEIDALVTTLLGVTCTNAAAAIGTDQQAAATTVAQCRAKLGSLSPNGPSGAYEYVALTPALTGIQTVTRARVYPDSDTGDVLLYIGGASGSVGSGDVAAVQSAVQQWSTPLCITPTVVSANPVNVPVTYTVWVYQSVNQTQTQVQAAIQTALASFFASRKIGGDIIAPATTGHLYQSEIQAVIGSVFPQTFRVSMSAPAADIALANGDVPQLGTVTATVNIVPGG
jgi:hypothetical protein